MSNYVYLKCENLTNEVKTRNKIKADAKIPRVDVTAQAGYYEPLQSLKNPSGMVFFNVLGTRGVINDTDLRRADVWLQCSAGNFSSVYMMPELCKENEIVAHGCPATVEFFKAKTVKYADGTTKTKPRPNPFYKYRNDGFMFIAKPDFTMIEIIVVQNGKHFIQSECQRYAGGGMNEVLATLRAAACPIFQY